MQIFHLKMKLIVLNYEIGDVDIINNIPNNIKNLEDFVYNKLNYKDSEVSWILLEDDSRTNYYTYNSGKMIYDNENFIDNDRCKSL